MRGILVAAITTLTVLGMAGAAGADVIPWHSTVITKLAAYPQLRIKGSGVASVDVTSLWVIHTLRIPGTNTGSGTIPITDPEVTVTIKSIRVAAGTRPATFRDFKNPPLTLNRGALSGSTRICVLFPGCSLFFLIPHSQNGGATALGVGGLLTAGGKGEIRFSLFAQPWTIGTASAVNQTLNGGFVTNTVMGLVHGLASGTSSPATSSGVVQLVTPAQLQSFGFSGNHELQSLFHISIFHFIEGVPEPGYLLLLGAGAAGLVALGRRRLRR